jgi:hypothetical protein
MGRRRILAAPRRLHHRHKRQGKEKKFPSLLRLLSPRFAQISPNPTTPFLSISDWDLPSSSPFSNTSLQLDHKEIALHFNCTRDNIENALRKPRQEAKEMRALRKEGKVVEVVSKGGGKGVRVGDSASASASAAVPGGGEKKKGDGTYLIIFFFSSCL